MQTLPYGLNYERVLLSPNPTMAEVRSLVPDYTAMLFTVMDTIATRYEQSPGYPYIDTKLDLITGEDFNPNDPLRGTGSVYGWIQGRGLEALADHCRWLQSHPQLPFSQQLLPRLEQMMAQVLGNLKTIREKNGGHLFFLMTPTGEPFTLQGDKRGPLDKWDESIYSFSDLFCAKGMFAAANYLEDERTATEAEEYARAVTNAVFDERFLWDEKSVDPEKGPQVPASPRPHGPYMISLGTAATMAKFSSNPEWIDTGLHLLQHLERFYIDQQTYDYWEMLDEQGRPYVTDGTLPSVPGHAIECPGLGLKFTAAAKGHAQLSSQQKEAIDRLEQLLPQVVMRNFANGFQPGVGIALSFDLSSHKPIDTNSPWWSLPESIRAATEAWSVSANEAVRKSCLQVLAQAHNAFALNFVRPDLHLMAYQMVSENGRPVAVIPATADADPGYHTGSSILDFMRVVEENFE